MCIDYRQLNRVTVQKKYSLPQIYDHFCQLQCTSDFLRLSKYKYQVMSFGFTNASATFLSLMNGGVHAILD
uniref:Uncharacterized protein n=1 Tax=Solanum lycopersicum TaxID=4081 RepID=A0A3Q7GPW0_SOLLC